MYVKEVDSLKHKNKVITASLIKSTMKIILHKDYPPFGIHPVSS